MKKKVYPIALNKRFILGAVYAMSLVGAMTSLCGLWSNLFTHLQYWFDRMYTNGMLYGSTETQKLTALLCLVAAIVGLICLGLILLRLLRRCEEYEGLAVWERVAVFLGIAVLVAVALSVWSAVRYEQATGKYAYQIGTDEYLHATELRSLAASLALYLSILLGVEGWSRRRAVAEQIKTAEDDLNRCLDP